MNHTAFLMDEEKIVLRAKTKIPEAVSKFDGPLRIPSPSELSATIIAKREIYPHSVTRLEPLTPIGVFVFGNSIVGFEWGRLSKREVPVPCPNSVSLVGYLE